MGNGAPMASMRVTRALNGRLRKVKYFFCDVDGVLTDATVIIGGNRELKQFNIQDGLGLVLLRRAGIKVGWISSRPSRATEVRARELKVDFLVQRKTSKVAAIDECLAETGGSWEEVCYTGDDLVDIGAIRQAGIGIAVANAVQEVKNETDLITVLSGGRGAVREIAELILKAQGRWNDLVAEYYG